MRRNYLHLVWLLATIGMSPCAGCAPTEESGSPNQVATDLIAKLETSERQDREDAIEALAEVDDSRVVPALRARLRQESDFHMRLALHYALAAQGEKSSVPELIASLRKSGHLGAVYLQRMWQGLWLEHRAVGSVGPRNHSRVFSPECDRADQAAACARRVGQVLLAV